MEQIKIKRIDNLVIVVTDTILQRTLEEGIEDSMYNKIETLVVQINSGLLSVRKLSSKKMKLLNIMTNKKRNKKETTALDSAYDLADGDVTSAERKEIMQKVSTIHKQFEYDSEGYVYSNGSNIPLPLDLANALLDAHYNENSAFTSESLLNFWNWTCLNPNDDARNDLFGWFKTGNFTITNSGQIIAYRCVAVKQQGDNSELIKFAEESYTKVKSWKLSPKDFAVISVEGGLDILNVNSNPEIVDNERFLGYLSELIADLNSNGSGDVYTDNHTKTMTIRIGEEVSMPRKDCDEERENSCSRGLHFMSKKYNLRLGGQKLVVLINPMNIVAFPSYDNTKGRCCAYLPVAKAMEDEHGDFLEFKDGTFDFDYAKYTQGVLEDLLEKQGLASLQEEGLISSLITEEDLFKMKDHFKDLLKSKVIDAR